jgi:hypothetical protein
MLYCDLYLDAKKPHLVEAQGPDPLPPLNPALRMIHTTVYRVHNF